MTKRSGTDNNDAAPSPKKGKHSVEEMKAAILGIMLQYHMDEKQDANFDTVAEALGIHCRNKTWRPIWTVVQDQGLVEASSGGKKGFVITPAGIEMAKTPEFEKFLKDQNFVAKTNEEHQNHIKSRLKMPKSVQIFDLYLKYGSLSKCEVAGLVRQKDRSHAFHYSFQELKKKKGLLEEDPDATSKVHGTKHCLSPKAFLKPEDRPEPEPIDSKELEEAYAWCKSSNPRTKKDTKEL